MPPHLLATPPPPQVKPGAHTPQSSRLPQPSATGPQSAFCWAQVRGVQPPVPMPHLFGTPAPPQESGATHMPHSTMPPQPLPIGPHSAPAAEQVFGVQLPEPH